ncbi:MAG: histidine phosphotransferase family protein [Sulfitobacter sp.]
MQHSTVDFAALIGSRICHDLISPIGAINNGLELLDMAGPGPGPEMDLIKDSVGNASARIRYFRIAYGSAGDQLIGRPEVTSILSDLTLGGRTEIAWGPTEPQKRTEVRLAFLGLQCLETAMPYGGRIEISKTDDSWCLHGSADKLNVDKDLWPALTANSVQSDLRPAHVQFGLLPQIAHDDGRLIATQIEDDFIRLSF